MTLKFIHTGWLLDGSGQHIQKDMVIIVDNNNTIVSIHPLNKALQKKITHDLSHYTVFPPLNDAHVHLSMSGTLDINQRKSQLCLDYYQAQNLITSHLNQYKKMGIYNVRDGGDHFGHTYRYKQNSKHKVCIYSPGIGWFRKGRYGTFMGQEIDQNEDCLERIQTFNHTDHVKIILSGINSVKHFGKQTAEQFSQNEMTTICRWAKQRRQKVMVHANGEKPVRIAIEAGCTSIEHGYFMGEENLKKMADQQIFWTPTLIPMVSLANHLTDPTEKDIARRTIEMQFELLLKAKQYGVPVVCGSDAGSYGVHHGQGLMEEFKLLVSCGYSLPQAIQSCTSLSNTLLGQKKCGILKKGQPSIFLQKEGPPQKW